MDWRATGCSRESVTLAAPRCRSMPRMRPATTLFAATIGSFVALSVGIEEARAQRAAPSGSGSTSVASYIVLADRSWPKQRDLNAEFKKRVPGYRPASKAVLQRMSSSIAEIKRDLGKRLNVRAGDFKSKVILGSIEGRLAVTTFAGAPNPLSADESFFRSAWWWRSAYKDLAQRKSHVIVRVYGSKDQKRDQLNLARLTAAVIAKTKAIGVIWDTADAVYRASRFAKSMSTAKSVMPADLAVSVKLGRDTQFPRKDGKPAWLALTYGLGSMGLKEIEFRGYDGDPIDLVKLLWNTSGYLMLHGDVIRDNETIGPKNKRQHYFRIEPSTLGVKGKVLRMRVVPSGQSSVQPGNIVDPKKRTK